jgi:MFS family permease
VGYLTALEWLPSLLFGMHAGAWADRRGRRRQLMIACDLGRCALLASVPACWALGVLTLWQLLAVVFAAGALSIGCRASPGECLTGPPRRRKPGQGGKEIQNECVPSRPPGQL